MKKILIQIIYMVCLLSILAASGCVAPPQETITPTGSTGSVYDPNQIMTATPSQSTNLLTDVTPFQAQTMTTPMGYTTLVPTTAITEDQVCLIDFASFNMSLESNKTAKKFNLKNPPMYINYTITKPFNVTGTRITTSKTGTKGEITTSYSYYNPYSYLEITARNPTTGEIYTQDGFGKSYGASLNKTIRITKPGELLIEISGFNVTPFVGFWAKPSGNFENTSIDFSTIECHSQDYVKRLNQ
jgi:hypothetical protein